MPNFKFYPILPKNLIYIKQQLIIFLLVSAVTFHMSGLSTLSF